MRKLFSNVLKYCDHKNSQVIISENKDIFLSKRKIKVVIWTKLIVKILLWLFALFLIANFAALIKQLFVR